MRAQYEFLTKDFVETSEGLVFALVAMGTEQGRVLGTLRYRRTAAGLRKQSTAEALASLQREFPKYYFHSPQRDCWLAGIPVGEIVAHFRPEVELQHSPDGCVHKTSAIFSELGDAMGITGSHLIGANGPDSDIDLVVYGVENFARAREFVASALDSSVLQPLSEDQWATTFQRRHCTDLSFEEYLWHEHRKCNKFSLDGIKVDLSLVAKPDPELSLAGKKAGRCSIRAKVIEDSFSFASPAMYRVDHESIRSIFVFTATYVGQACVGEVIEAVGALEHTQDGSSRLIIGASREAPGEYLKVVR